MLPSKHSQSLNLILSTYPIMIIAAIFSKNSLPTYLFCVTLPHPGNPSLHSAANKPSQLSLLCCINYCNQTMQRDTVRKGRLRRHPVFLIKLQEMLRDKEIDDSFGWTNSGDSFSIKNVTKFIQEVLPKYFTHKNFSSFIRQLNLYGFRKIQHTEGQNVYSNGQFKRGDALPRLPRRFVKRQPESAEAIKVDRQKSIEQQLGELVVRQKNLEQLCKNVLRENQKLVEGCQNLALQQEHRMRQSQQGVQRFLTALLAKRAARLVTRTASAPGFLTEAYGLNVATGDKSLMEMMSSDLKQSRFYSKVIEIRKAINAKIVAKGITRRYPPQVVYRSNRASSELSCGERELICGEMGLSCEGREELSQAIDFGSNHQSGFLSFNSFLDFREEAHGHSPYES